MLSPVSSPILYKYLCVRVLVVCKVCMHEKVPLCVYVLGGKGCVILVNSIPTC